MEPAALQGASMQVPPDRICEATVGVDDDELDPHQNLLFVHSDGVAPRADSKSHHGFGSGCCCTIASSALMSCITACIPARID